MCIGRLLGACSVAASAAPISAEAAWTSARDTRPTAAGGTTTPAGAEEPAAAAAGMVDPAAIGRCTGRFFRIACRPVAVAGEGTDAPGPKAAFGARF